MSPSAWARAKVARVGSYQDLAPPEYFLWQEDLIFCLLPSFFIVFLPVVNLWPMIQVDSLRA